MRYDTRQKALALIAIAGMSSNCGLTQTALTRGTKVSAIPSTEGVATNKNQSNEGDATLALDDLEQTIAKAKKMYEEANDANDAVLASKILDLVNKLTALKSVTDPKQILNGLASLMLDFAMLSKELDARQSKNVQTLALRVDTLEGSIDAVKKMQTTLAEMFNAQITSMDEKTKAAYESLNAKLAFMAADLSDLQKASATMSTSISTLTQKQEGLKSGLESLSSQYTDSQKDYLTFVATVNQSFSDINTKVSDLQSQQAATEDGLKSEIAARQADRDSMNAALAGLRTSVKENGDAVEGLEKKVADQLAGLQATIAANFDAAVSHADAVGAATLTAAKDALNDATAPLTAKISAANTLAQATADSLLKKEGELTAQISAAKAEAATSVDALKQSLILDMNHRFSDQASALDARFGPLEGAVTTITNNLTDLTDLTKQGGLLDQLTNRVTKVEVTAGDLSTRLGKVETSVTDLQTRMTTAESAISALDGKVAGLENSMGDMQETANILKFAKGRAEAAAALMEKYDVAMAWVTTRSAQINTIFCRDQYNLALRSYDYKAANHNLMYCRDKLAVLTAAAAQISTVKAQLNAILSANIDTRCNADIDVDGTLVAAEQLTDAQLLMRGTMANGKTGPVVLARLLAQCSTGLARARGLMLDVAASLKIIPDHRTHRYITTVLAPLAKEILLAVDSSEPIIDPLNPDLITTPYGAIERIFVKHYIDAKYRIPDVIPGTYKYPEKLGDIGPNPSGTVLTYNQIAANPVLAAVELDTVVEPVAGFKAERINGVVTIHKNGKDAFSYPNPVQTLCPVADNFVVGGKVYQVYYQDHKEIVGPALNSQAAHADILASSSPLQISRTMGAANLPRIGVVRVSQPYGSKGAQFANCARFTHTYMLKADSWTHPDVANTVTGGGINKIDSYLNGFQWSGESERSKNPIDRYLNGVLHKTNLVPAYYYDYDLGRGRKAANSWPTTTLYAYKELSVAGSASAASLAKISKATTQLADYWISGPYKFFTTTYETTNMPLYANTADPAKSYGGQYIREEDTFSNVAIQDGFDCRYLPIGNPIVIKDFAGTERIRFGRATYMYTGSGKSAAGDVGGRCAIDTVACVAFDGTLLLSNNVNFYSRYLYDSCPNTKTIPVPRR